MLIVKRKKKSSFLGSTIVLSLRILFVLCVCVMHMCVLAGLLLLQAEKIQRFGLEELKLDN